MGGKENMPYSLIICGNILSESGGTHNISSDNNYAGTHKKKEIHTQMTLN